MKSVCKVVSVFLVLLAVSAYGFSQRSPEKPAATAQNLVRGVFGPLTSNNSWANYSLINEIPGSGLYSITSSTTVFYFGFTAGSEADISNMVVYTTARGSLVITAKTPVTLGGVSNPSINLSSTSVCPTQPLSAANPCIVRFDPTTLTLSPANDYYFVVFFTNDSNNSSLGGAEAAGIAPSSLNATYVGGTDETQLAVGQSVPQTNGSNPYFLMYVMTN